MNPLQQSEVNNELMNLLITNLQLFASKDVDWWSDWRCMDYYMDYYVFIHYLTSYSDGTHSLLRIHWWASDVISQNLFWCKISFLGELLL